MTNINLEHLVNSVLEKFEYFANYEIKSKDYFSFVERDYQAVHHGNNYIYDVCKIIKIDISKLYSFTRAIRKWNERNQWQTCFDFKAHEEKIIKYLKE